MQGLFWRVEGQCESWYQRDHIVYWWALPLKYFGVLLASKKLFIHHYMDLIDRIVMCIKHWSTKLISYIGRLRLINKINISMSTYWMSCLPFPKKVIQKIDTIYRSFLWTVGDTISKKSPISWKQVCTSKYQDGLNLISLEEWNKANIAKLLWNLSGKTYSLWIKWVYIFYLKSESLFSVKVNQNASWIIKGILKQRGIA